MRKDLTIVGVSVGLSLLIGAFVFGGIKLGGDFTHTLNEVFLQGLRAGTSQTQVIDRNGALVSRASSTGSFNIGNLQLDGASTTTEFSCGTASYTVPALGARFGSGTAHATTSVTVPGATNGDQLAGLGWNPQSATGTLTGNGIMFGAEVTTGTTAIVGFWNMTNTTSSAIATGTISVCYRTVT